MPRIDITRVLVATIAAVPTAMIAVGVLAAQLGGRALWALPLSAK